MYTVGVIGGPFLIGFWWMSDCEVSQVAHPFGDLSKSFLIATFLVCILHFLAVLSLSFQSIHFRAIFSLALYLYVAKFGKWYFIFEKKLHLGYKMYLNLSLILKIYMWCFICLLRRIIFMYPCENIITFSSKRFNQNWLWTFKTILYVYVWLICY